MNISVSSIFVINFQKHTNSIGRSPPTTPAVFHGTDSKWNPDSPLHPIITEGSTSNPNSDSSITSTNGANLEVPAESKPPSIDLKTDRRSSGMVNNRPSVISKGVNQSVGSESILTFFSATLHR